MEIKRHNGKTVGYSYLHVPYITIANEIERRRLLDTPIKPRFSWKEWLKSIFTFKEPNIFNDETDYTKGFYK